MLTDVLVGNVSPIPEPGDKVWVSFSSPVAPRVLSLSGFSEALLAGQAGVSVWEVVLAFSVLMFIVGYSLRVQIK